MGSAPLVRCLRLACGCTIRVKQKLFNQAQLWDLKLFPSF